jgi:hypothetical protein
MKSFVSRSIWGILLVSFSFCCIAGLLPISFLLLTR